MLIVARDLGVKNYGIFSVFMALFVIMGQLHDFGLSVSLVKVGSQLKNDKNAYFNLFISASILKVFISAFFLLLLYPFSYHIGTFLLNTDIYTDEIKLIILLAPLYSIFLFFLSYFQAKQEFTYYSYSNIMVYLSRLIFSLAIAYIFVINFDKLLLYTNFFMLAYALPISIIIIIMLSKRTLTYIKFQLSYSYLKELISLGFWAFLSALSIMLILRIDIFMLEKLSNSHAVGLYSAAFQVAMVFPLITSALFTTVFPKAHDFIKNYSLSKYIVKTLSLSKYSIPLLVLVEVGSYYLFPLLYGIDYRSGTTTLMILLISYSLEIFINPLISLFYLYKKAYIYSFIILIQLILNFLGNLYLIPLYNANGAAISTTIARIIGLSMIILYALYLKKRSNESHIVKGNDYD